MSIKVVRGLIGSDSPPENLPKAADAVRASASNTTATVAASQRVASSEAVITAVRAFRPNLPMERIREEREAKTVAKEIAESVKSSGQALEAHTKLNEVAEAHLTE